MFILSEVLTLVPDKDKQLFLSFFKNAPQFIYERANIKNLLPGQALITSEQNTDEVFIHISGKLQGVDAFRPDIIYNFIEFYPVNIIGDFEAFTDKENYLINISAKTNSTLISINTKDFLSWMQCDIEAINIICRLLAFKLTNELKVNREYLFLNSYQRLLLYLYDISVKHSSDKQTVTIYKKHSEIGDEIGFCEKTICRTVKKLASEGFVSSGRNAIKISPKQFLLLQEALEELQLI